MAGMMIVESVFDQFIQIVDLSDRNDGISPVTGMDRQGLIVIVADNADAAVAFQFG